MITVFKYFSLSLVLGYQKFNNKAHTVFIHNVHPSFLGTPPPSHTSSVKKKADTTETMAYSESFRLSWQLQTIGTDSCRWPVLTFADSRSWQLQAAGPDSCRWPVLTVADGGSWQLQTAGPDSYRPPVLTVADGRSWQLQTAGPDSCRRPVLTVAHSWS